MDETLAMALRVFFAMLAPRVEDQTAAKAIEKVDQAIARVAEGELTATQAASYIRDVVVVLS